MYGKESFFRWLLLHFDNNYTYFDKYNQNYPNTINFNKSKDYSLFPDHHQVCALPKSGITNNYLVDLRFYGNLVLVLVNIANLPSYNK